MRDMVGCIVLFAALCLAGLFGAAAFKKPFAFCLSAAILGVVLLAYLFGLFGALRFGVYFAFALCLLLGAAAGVLFIRRKAEGYAALRQAALPMLVITGAFLLLLWINYERVPTGWDEYSHWALAAKSMYTINGFGTSSASKIYFQSYPPAMTVLQYSFLVIRDLFSARPGYADWPLYVAFGTASAALLTAFLDFSRQKKCARIAAYLLFAGVLLNAPQLGLDVYSSLYIDGFLAVLAAYAIFAASQSGSAGSCAALSLSAAVLPLTKDAGLYFAFAAVLLYEALLLFSKRNRALPLRRKILFALLPALALAFAKLTWQAQIDANHVQAMFAKPVDWSALAGMLTGSAAGRENLTIAKNFVKAFFELRLSYAIVPTFRSGHTIMLRLGQASFFLLTILLTGASAAQWAACRRRGSDSPLSKNAVLSPVFVTAFYILGLCFTYMVQFDKGEAVALASYGRYMQIGYVCWLVLLIHFAARLMDERPPRFRRGVFYAALACVSFTMMNLGWLMPAALRTSVEASQQFMKDYTAVEQLTEKIPADASVYIVSQRDSGFDYWVLRYKLYPRTVNTNYTWNIDEPYLEGEREIPMITAAQWRQSIFSYDYLLLFHTDSHFAETFGDLFANPPSIADRSLYRINSQTGLLEAP